MPGIARRIALALSAASLVSAAAQDGAAPAPAEPDRLREEIEIQRKKIEDLERRLDRLLPAADPAAGQAVFESHCAPCHGLRGDGRGPGAAALDPPPRDFTSGLFKFRSTPYGQLPTDDDLLRVVRRGIPRTDMPGFEGLLSDREMREAVEYVKSFDARFRSKGAGPPVPVPPAPSSAEALVDEGGRLYVSLGCAACHGESGRGDGPSAEGLSGSRGNPVRPADLTTVPLKGGSTHADVWRAVATGLSGSPMPSYHEGVSDGDRHALAAFVLSLARRPKVRERLFRLDPLDPSVARRETEAAR